MSNPLYIDSYDVKPVEMDGTKKNPANSGKNVTGHSVYDKLQEVPSLEESYSQHSGICAPRRRSSMSATSVHHLGRALGKTGAELMPFRIRYVMVFLSHLHDTGGAASPRPPAKAGLPGDFCDRQISLEGDF